MLATTFINQHIFQHLKAVNNWFTFLGNSNIFQQVWLWPQKAPSMWGQEPCVIISFSSSSLSSSSLFLSFISSDSLVHCDIITNLDSEIFSHRQTDRDTDRRTDRPIKVDLEAPPPGALYCGQGRVQKLFWVVLM